MIEMGNLKGERVDPHLRIRQVDKILLKSDHLTATQRRSLVSRRNTAKLRQRQKNQRDHARLMCIELDVIENAVSTSASFALASKDILSPYPLALTDFFSSLFSASSKKCNNFPS